MFGSLCVVCSPVSRFSRGLFTVCSCFVRGLLAVRSWCVRFFFVVFHLVWSCCVDRVFVVCWECIVSVVTCS